MAPQEILQGINMYWKVIIAYGQFKFKQASVFLLPKSDNPQQKSPPLEKANLGPIKVKLLSHSLW